MTNCKHHWIVDSQNVQTCKLCHIEVNCQPGIDKALHNSNDFPVHNCHLERNLCITNGWYIQGGFHKGYAFGPGVPRKSVE